MSKLKSQITKEKILQALSSVTDNDHETDIVTAGMISSVVIRGNSVGFAIEVDINEALKKEGLRKECEQAVLALKGVDKVTAVLTSAQPGMLSVEAKPEPEQKRSLTEKASSKASSDENKKPIGLKGVKNIIIVASGKGGVGKSTVTTNLARSMTKAGKKVGIADLDIYGPSVPQMLGQSGQPDVGENNRIIPKESEGIKSISIGYMVEAGNAIVWRSSMVLKAMNQLMLSVNWGELDCLIIDTPPGTGDIQLSLAKNYDISGVVVVSTPQEVALIDVERAVSMFTKVDIEIFGIIENMSFFEDSSGVKNYIFGEGGAKKLAEKSNIDFLGEIPIKQEIRESGDKGIAPKDLSIMDRIAASVISKLK